MISKGYSPDTREKYKKTVIKYIQDNPNATWTQIRDKTSIKIERIFSGGLRTAYREAGMPLPISLSKRTREEQKREYLECIKSNPKCTVKDLYYVLGLLPQRIFGSIAKAYDLAEEEYPQRTMPSVANSKIRIRAYKFENEVLNLLKIRGTVQKYQHNKYGISDAIFERDGKRYVIEIKDYKKKSITMHEIKQLYRYIEGTENCCDGILITHRITKKPKSKIYIDGNRISVIAKEDIIHGDLA